MNTMLKGDSEIQLVVYVWVCPRLRFTNLAAGRGRQVPRLVGIQVTAAATCPAAAVLMLEDGKSILPTEQQQQQQV